MPSEKPPFFKTWNQMYLFVVAVLVIQIIVFTLISRYYA